MTDVLLRDILGARFDAMPESVRRMHDIESTRDVRGISRVIGGTNPVGRLIRVLLPRFRSRHTSRRFIFVSSRVRISKNGIVILARAGFARR